MRARGADLWAATKLLRDSIVEFLTSRGFQKFMIHAILILGFASSTFFISIPAYIAFYHFHLPDQIVKVPLHLQYGYHENPFAVVSVAHVNIKNSQAYDIDIMLTLPHSPDNMNRGNFMVGLLLLGDKEGAPKHSSHLDLASPFVVPPLDIPSYIRDKQILHAATRPTRVPYRSPLVAKASTLLRLPYSVIWPGAETDTLVVSMMERVRFDRGTPVPTSLVVEVQAGQMLQVYDAVLTLRAQLSGLRYFMYQHRLTAFFLFTGMFYVTAMLAFIFFLVLPVETTPNGEQPTAAEAGAESDSDGPDDRGNRGRAVVKEESQPVIKVEKNVKQGEGEGIESNVPPLTPGTEADDEGDGNARPRDLGIGTSYSDHKNREGQKRRRSKGGH